MNKLAGFLLLFPLSGWCCRPVSGFKYPTINESFQKAALVVLGNVVIQTKDKNIFSFELAVEKVIKGKADKVIKARTTASTCDPLGYDVEVGSYCLIMVNDQGATISGLTGGYASECILKSATPEQKKSFREKWEKELKFPKS